MELSERLVEAMLLDEPGEGLRVREHNQGSEDHWKHASHINSRAMLMARMHTNMLIKCCCL
jgi:hypothetical protein